MSYEWDGTDPHIPVKSQIDGTERWFVCEMRKTHLVVIAEAVGESQAFRLAAALDAESNTLRRRLRDPLIDRAAS